jgi:outer membrane protein TolC
VISAEAALTQALTNEVSARYDFLSAKAQLERATASQPEYKELAAHSPAAVAGKGVGQ